MNKDDAMGHLKSVFLAQKRKMIIKRYADFMTEPKPHCIIYSESMLPFPKKVIEEAILTELSHSSEANYTNWLMIGLTFLSDYAPIEESIIMPDPPQLTGDKNIDNEALRKHAYALGETDGPAWLDYKRRDATRLKREMDKVLGKTEATSCSKVQDVSRELPANNPTVSPKRSIEIITNTDRSGETCSLKRSFRRKDFLLSDPML